MKLKDKIQKEKQALRDIPRNTPEHDRQWDKIRRLLLRQANGER